MKRWELATSDAPFFMNCSQYCSLSSHKESRVQSLPKMADTDKSKEVIVTDETLSEKLWNISAAKAEDPQYINAYLERKLAVHLRGDNIL